MNPLHTCRCCAGGGITLIPSLTGVAEIVDCDICKGTGLVMCLLCDDTGWMPVGDRFGDYAGDEPCVCHLGHQVMRQQPTADSVHREPF